jgi:hypothetical protein
MMHHVTVFKRAGVYAGWPANHGAWQWNNELLVGFMSGVYKKGGMHAIRQPFTKLLARSIDGGETWNIEQPNVSFNGMYPTEGYGLMSHEIIRVCGVYDHGGEDCDEQGAFYASPNKGRHWDGPYKFKGLEDVFMTKHFNTSRTCTLGNLVFLSHNRKEHWGTDRVFCAQLDRLDSSFKFKSWVCDDEYRAVMPSVARIDGRIVCAIRRRGDSHRYMHWVDVFASDDMGATWRHLQLVGDTGAHNGNPPALIEAEGRLFCAFGNRTLHSIQLYVSLDRGGHWQLFDTLRQGGNSDIGYPRLFKRIDGQLVCVYYWSDHRGDEQRIESTIIDVRQA